MHTLLGMHTFLNLAAFIPTLFLTRQSCFFLPLLQCKVVNDENVDLCLSFALRAASVLERLGLKVRPSAEGARSLASITNSSHLPFKT